MTKILSNKTNLPTSVGNLEEFRSMLNKSIDTGRRKVQHSGKRTRMDSSEGQCGDSNRDGLVKISPFSRLFRHFGVNYSFYRFCVEMSVNFYNRNWLPNAESAWNFLDEFHYIIASISDQSREHKHAKFEIFTTGGGDHTVTLSKETMLDVNMQEINSKYLMQLCNIARRIWGTWGFTNIYCPFWVRKYYAISLF